MATMSTTSRSWNAVHRRGEVLRRVVAEANSRRDGNLPMDLPGVTETFEDDFALVAALQLRWHTRLSGNIERALMDAPMEPEDAVLTAWRSTASELAGVRQILDARAAAPTSERMARALETARRKDWGLMAAMAGLASAQDQTGIAVGRALEQRVRAVYDPTRDSGPPRHRQQQSGQRTGRQSCRLTFLDRIKAVLAA